MISLVDMLFPFADASPVLDIDCNLIDAAEKLCIHARSSRALLIWTQLQFPVADCSCKMDDSDATLSRPLIDDQKYDSDTQSQRSIRTTLWPWLTTLAATVAALLITVVYHSHSISDHACHAGELSKSNPRLTFNSLRPLT